MNGVVRALVSGQFLKLLSYWSEFITVAVAVDGMETQLDCTGSDSLTLRCYWSEGPHRSSPDPAEGINQRATPQQSQLILNYLTVEIEIKGTNSLQGDGPPCTMGSIKLYVVKETNSGGH